MKKTFATAIVTGMLALPAFAGGHASGDAGAGEKVFNQCKACHSIVSADGETIVRGGKTGPNLWGLPGRTAGTEADFGRYKDSIVAAGEAGLAWDEEHFVSYVQDPTAFLKDYLDDPKARSGMAFKIRSEEDAANVWAYIASVSPEPQDSGS